MTGVMMKKKDSCSDSEKKEAPSENDKGKIIQLPDWKDPELKKQYTEDCKEKENSNKTSTDIISITPTYYTKYGISEKDVMRCLRDNEDGDAELFLRIFKDQCLYDHMEETWYYWNDHYWRLDVLQHRFRRVLNVIGIYHEQITRELDKIKKCTTNQENDKVKKHESNVAELVKRKELLQTQYRKNNVLKTAAQGVESLGYSGESWDQKPHLFGVKNGVVDLVAGTFDPSGGRQTDYIKTVAPTDWRGIDEPCPTWERFISDIFLGREEMPDFMQRLLGYALRGDTLEHIFPILYGAEGRNGKGTLFEVIKHIMGPLAYKAPSEFLMTKVSSQQTADAPSATLMKLRGTRLVWCSETNEGDRIDAAKLKELVGGDTISARSPYGKRQIEFTPTHTLFTMTNKKPQMPPNDPALWQRIYLILFNMRFVDNPDPKKPNELKADKELMSKLMLEASGILAWMVKGAIMYEKQGLMPPDEVFVATQQYREDEDILGHFVSECCEVGDPENPAYRTKAKELYDEYKKWCFEVGHHQMAKKKFRDQLSNKFQERRDGRDSVRKFFGIALVSSFSYV